MAIYYRGGNNVAPKPNEVRLDRTTGLLRTTHGISVFDRSDGLWPRSFLSLCNLRGEKIRMATHLEPFTILFPEGFDERQEFEMPSKGYLRDLVVRLEDGAEYQLFFIDPTRLQQDLEADAQEGRDYYAEPGM